MSRIFPGFVHPTLMAVGLSLAFIGAGCSSDDEPASNTIADIASSSPSFTTLAAALERTGLDEALAGEGPFTVFAPTDEAFARLPAGLLAQLDDATLAKILTYHVVAGQVDASQVAGLESAATLHGQGIAISASASGVMLNARTMVTTTDVFADNGVIHIIDSVMLPPELGFPGTLVDLALAYPAFDTLVGAVASASLVEALGGDNEGAGLTVFAPTNEAFAKLGIELSSLSAEALTDILLYHVVGDTVSASEVVGLSAAPTLLGKDVAIDASGGSVMLNGQVQVIATDIYATNGVLHIIDGVLIPE